MPSIATLWKPRDCWMSWTNIWERVTNNTFVEISILTWKEILCDFFSGRTDSICKLMDELIKGSFSLALWKHMIYFLKQQFKHRLGTARFVVPCFTIRYTIADMAIWPWIGWLVDGKIYGEAGEFLQVKDGYVEDEGKERLLFTWPFFKPCFAGFQSSHF